MNEILILTWEQYRTSSVTLLGTANNVIVLMESKLMFRVEKRRWNRAENEDWTPIESLPNVIMNMIHGQPILDSSIFEIPHE